LLYVLHKAVRLTIPWRNIAKYTVASAIMAPILIAGHPVTRISTLLFTGIGALVYLGLLVAIDKEARILAREMLQSVRGRMKRKKTT
jgi:hypothetical protein